MDNLQFQIYDYRETHQNLEEDDSEMDTLGEYIIQVFGRTQDGKSVYAKLKDFQPRFYIKVPDNWTNRHAERIEKYLKSKDNKKVWHNYRQCLLSCSLVKRKKAYGFTNNKIFKFIVLMFNNSFACRKFASLFELNSVYIPGVTTRAKKFPVYEANLTPMLRCFHIQDVPGCGWVETSNFELVKKNKNKESTCDYEIILSYKDLKPIQKESNAPLRICSFDIECDSCDGMFPQANRPKDNIIQIGCTYTYLGQSEPYRQYICTLKSCDEINGATVESFDDERDLLMAWVKETITSDADILTGYNIFYFDEKYIFDRAKMLGIEHDIKYLSKLKTHRCQFKEQKLASSALGENLLRYFDTPGLVHIDLMKDVQKTYNLNSYKLDKVASNFIKGNVLEIKKSKGKNKYQLICNQINDLHLEDYIHLELMESFVSEDIGEKFKVLKLDTINKIITIETDIDLINECDFSRGKIFWSQAKDDVPPKEIFRMQHLGSKERCIVAKYCLKDCRLVNLLINKLEVVTKNIEMANVCYVPLSYLFVRGQGIKLFSLCLKEFRNYGFLFPVVRKPEEDQGSYEGAIVFDPIPNVSYQAYAVKDYASLYPSSIIHKNMSHETKIDDDEYDNLPGITYFNAQFRENDGSIQYRRFAKLDGEFGVVPTILRTLLGERKAVKKQMKTEKDPFKYAILDAKQLALKVTANSLYGQLGASTSPVRERDIAACTTSTGREMLILAKKYDEEILPWVINGLQKAYQENDQETIDFIYKKEMKDFTDEKLKDKIKNFCAKTSNYVFNPIIKYGDSVTGDTPLLLRHIDTKKQFITNIKSIGFEYTSGYHGDKEISPIDNLEVWSDIGWTRVVNIIRHKLHSDKKLLRIQTDQSIVTVTDEHSLLDNYGDVIDAKELNVGDKILQRNPDSDFIGNISEFITIGERIFINPVDAQYFYCCLVNSYFYKFKLTFNEYDNTYVFTYDNNMGFHNNIIRKITEIEHNNPYVYDLTTENHHFHAGIGSIIVHNTDSIFSCYMYKENMDKVRSKYKLELFKNIIKFGKTLLTPFLPKDNQTEFSELYDKYYGNIINLKLPSSLKVKPYPSHHNIILPVRDRLKQLLKEYMEESYFPWLWTLHDIFTEDLTYLDNKQREDIIQVKLFQHGNSQIEKIRLTPQMLSDEDKHTLITKIKTFCKDILKNNYLIPYWRFNPKKELLEYRMDFKNKGIPIRDKRNLDESIDLGIISGELIKSRLAFPHDLEYEKTFWPYLILTKKRYVGNKYEFDRDKYKLDYMGIVLKRRDNAPIVKEVCSGIINKLIEDRDPEGAYKFLEDSLEKMFNDEYNIKYFLTSKTLKMKESYADWTRIAHVVLSERIGERDPGNKPQAGDRITFAAIQVPETKGMLQGDRIEIPEYIKENNLKIDYFFYLTNQIEKPALQFLKLAVPNAEERLKDFKIRMDNKRKGIADIHSYISKPTSSKLTSSKSHTSSTYKPGEKTSSILDNLISSKLYDF